MVSENGNKNLIFGSGNVLLVDDEHINRRILSEMLKKLGYSVIEAQNGEECIELFMQHYEEIDAIVLDVLMPLKDGIETYKELQDFEYIPKVLLMSGVELEGDLEDCIDNINTFYFQKPVKLHDLSELMATLMGLKYC